MSTERGTYLDSSAIVKIATNEPESRSLRRCVHSHQPLVASALARTEVARSLMPLGPEAFRRGQEVLATVDLARVSDRILVAAGTLRPASLRSLDAIHVATAQRLGESLGRLVTYDERMASAAKELGLRVVSPR